MRLVLAFRELWQSVSDGLVRELDQIVQRINTVWAVQHNGDGTHGALTYTVKVVDGRQGYTLTAADSGTLYHTADASVTVSYVLPIAETGLTYGFYVGNSKTVTITCSAVSEDVIRLTVDETDPGGSISSSTQGSYVQLVAVDASRWVGIIETGAWVM